MNGKNLELCWNLFFMLFKNEQHLSLSGTFCFILMFITVPEFNVKCNVNSMLYSSINDQILFFMSSVIVWFILLYIFRSTRPEVFFRKTVLKIWRTPMPKHDFNKVAKQLYWNCISARMFWSKFGTYFQKNFL